MSRKRPWLKWGLIAFGGLLVLGVLAAEVVLRVKYGFCQAVLMRNDDSYEYIAQPSQTRRRFGNTIHYNSYSQRSEEPSENAVKILFLGDSVVNGGTLTDQDDLASMLVEKELCVRLGGMFQVLNISSGSWGPDNCNAYLDKHGLFGASALVLVASSHDAYDIMTNYQPAGNLVSYPDKQYSLALSELYFRYGDHVRHRLLGMFSRKAVKAGEAMAEFDRANQISKASREFNPGFKGILDKSKQAQIPMLLVLHAEIGEQRKGMFTQGGDEIQAFASANGVSLVDDLGKLETKDYRENDPIHLSASGQRKLAKIILEELVKIIRCHKSD